MADQVSVVEDIARVATSGLELVQQLYEIAHRVSASGHEVRSCAKDTNTFSKTLLLIRTQISLRISPLELDLIKEIMGHCQEIFAPLIRVQQTLNRVIKLHRSEERKLEQIGQRVQWYFSEKQKLLFFREALRGQQQNLNILLAALTYDTSRDLLDEMALENTLREGSYSANESTPQVSIKRHSPPSFLPPTASKLEVQGSDGESRRASPRISLNLEKNCQIDLDFLTEQEIRDLDDQIEDDLDTNREGVPFMLWEDPCVFSRRTKQFAESILESTKLCNVSPIVPSSPEHGTWKPKSNVGNVPSGENGYLSHSRNSSGCSDSSTLRGSGDEDEDFPMRKDRMEDVIQVIEIPLKSPLRRRMSLFGRRKSLRQEK